MYHSSIVKEPWEWIEDDLLRLVSDSVQESLTLDYKRSAALASRNARVKDSISKDVSAFANSAGGTLVYGIAERGHLPVGVDEGLDPHEVTREWLEQVINSTIQRRVSGVRVNQVRLNESAPGRVAYVVHIPQSHDAPHMANDHRYYKRFNFESAPMEDYEVRDVGNRSDGPSLFLNAHLVAGADLLLTPRDDSGRSIDFEVGLTLANRSREIAEHRIIQTYTDSRLSRSQGGKKLEMEIGDLLLPVERWSENHSPVRHMPVWSEVNFALKTMTLSVPNVDADADYVLHWTIDAPRMSTTEGFAVIRARQRTVSIENMEHPPTSLHGYIAAQSEIEVSS